MAIKRVLAVVVGAVQSLIGILSMASAYLIYDNPRYLEMRTILSIPNEYVTLCILLLSIFSLFSIISGLLIIYEWSIRSTEA